MSFDLGFRIIKTRNKVEEKNIENVDIVCNINSKSFT